MGFYIMCLVESVCDVLKSEGKFTKTQEAVLSAYIKEKKKQDDRTMRIEKKVETMSSDIIELKTTGEATKEKVTAIESHISDLKDYIMKKKSFFDHLKDNKGLVVLTGLLLILIFGLMGLNIAELKGIVSLTGG